MHGVEVHAMSWEESLNKRDHLEDLGEDGRIILKIILKEPVGRS
jgi:hypothetical protein